MKTNFYFVTVFLILAALAAAGCSGSERPGQTQASTVRAAIYRVASQELPLYTTTLGTLEPFEKAQLSTRIMGQVDQVLVKEGERVRAGQVLVRLDKKDITSRIEQAGAGLAAAGSQRDNAETFYRRIERLFNEKSATQQQLDNARTQYESAQSAVKAAESMIAEGQANLNYADITSPLNGCVTAKRVERGDLAAPGMPLITVEKNDSMKIVTSVSEQEVGRIKPGGSGWIQTDIPGLARRQARIETVEPAGDPRTRRFTVKLVLDNRDVALRSGFFARVDFETGAEQTIAVPDSAVLRRGEMTGMFVVDENNLSRLRWVRLGRKSGELVEVLSGIDPGDRVIAGNLRLMREGQTVEEVTR